MKESVEIIAVAKDSKEDLQKMIDRIERDFGERPELTFLSDHGHRVIDRYGLLNPSGRGLPHPATYVIDKRGIVRWKFVETDYRIRPTNEQVLEALRELD